MISRVICFRDLYVDLEAVGFKFVSYHRDDEVFQCLPCYVCEIITVPRDLDLEYEGSHILLQPEEAIPA